MRTKPVVLQVLGLTMSVGFVGCKTTATQSKAKDEISDSPNADDLGEAAKASARGDGKLLKIADFKGGSFLDFMTAPGGLREAMDADEAGNVVIADAASIHSQEKQFDPTVPKKVYGLFGGGEKDFDSFIGEIAGQSAAPDNITALIKSKLENLADQSKLGLDAMIAAPFVAISSGAGVPVLIDGGNSFVNYGYLPGEKSTDAVGKAAAVKTGRSFGANSSHALLDVSDNRFLTELSDMLSGGKQDVGQFFRVLLQVLTSCDTSGVASLSAPGQEVLSDFLAVYTAELRRHLMVNLGASHPWEIDLGATTIVSAYFIKAKTVPSPGKLVPGKLTSFFGIGTAGSGIGETRSDREGLSVRLSKAELAANSAVAAKMAKVKAMLNISGDDIIQGLMQALSNPKLQKDIANNGAAIADAYADFAADIYQHAESLKL